jgi:hypothetical protein
LSQGSSLVRLIATHLAHAWVKERKKTHLGINSAQKNVNLSVYKITAKLDKKVKQLLVLLLSTDEM